MLLTELGYRSAAGSNMQFSAPARRRPRRSSRRRSPGGADRAAAAAVVPGLYYWNYLPDLQAADATGYLLHGERANGPRLGDSPGLGRAFPATPGPVAA